MAVTEVDPFLSMKTQSREFLHQLDGRAPCPKCRKSRKFYCYSCCILIGEVEQKLTKVKLPIKVDIIKHPNEVDGKSTAPHAAVISPDDVSLYIFPCIPDYDREKVILVFPCKDSVTLDDLVDLSNSNAEVSGSCETTKATCGTPVGYTSPDSGCGMQGSSCDTVDNGYEAKGNCCENPLRTSSPGYTEQCMKQKLENLRDQADSGSLTERECEGVSGSCEHVIQPTQTPRRKAVPSFEKVVFIDSTWLQSKQIFRDERLKDLRHVELKTRHTRFWRPQGDHPETYLSTIEAIYYFIRDFHDIFILNKYQGEYDNLLFFFLYTYEKVQQSTSKKTRKR